MNLLEISIRSLKNNRGLALVHVIGVTAAILIAVVAMNRSLQNQMALEQVLRSKITQANLENVLLYKLSNSQKCACFFSPIDLTGVSDKQVDAVDFFSSTACASGGTFKRSILDSIAKTSFLDTIHLKALNRVSGTSIANGKLELVFNEKNLAPVSVSEFDIQLSFDTSGVVTGCRVSMPTEAVVDVVPGAIAMRVWSDGIDPLFRGGGCSADDKLPVPPSPSAIPTGFPAGIPFDPSLGKMVAGPGNTWQFESFPGGSPLPNIDQNMGVPITLRVLGGVPLPDKLKDFYASSYEYFSNPDDFELISGSSGGFYEHTPPLVNVTSQTYDMSEMTTNPPTVPISNTLYIAALRKSPDGQLRTLASNEVIVPEQVPRRLAPLDFKGTRISDGSLFPKNFNSTTITWNCVTRPNGSRQWVGTDSGSSGAPLTTNTCVENNWYKPPPQYTPTGQQPILGGPC